MSWFRFTSFIFNYVSENWIIYIKYRKGHVLVHKSEQQVLSGNENIREGWNLSYIIIRRGVIGKLPTIVGVSVRSRCLDL